MRKIIALTALFLSAIVPARAITPVPMSSQPGNTYTENFSDVTNWAANLSSGIGASCWYGTGIGGTATIPDPTKITAATSNTWTTGTSGGKQKGGSNLVFLVTGATDNSASLGVDMFLNFTGVNAGTLSFDWAQVSNTTGDRVSTLRVYGSTDGTTFTELTAARAIVTNNVVGSGTISAVALPASFNNSATARLRFYFHNATGGTTGSRPKISIDNVTVTAVAGGVMAPTLTASATGPTDIAVSWTPNASNDQVLVAWNSTNSFGTPSGVYASNDTIAGGGTVLYAGSATSLVHSSLTSGTTYYYKAWSFDASTNYSSAASAQATTPIPNTPAIAITTPAATPASVSNDVTTYTFAGVGTNLTGDISWSFPTAPTSGTVAAGSTWSVGPLPLIVGANTFIVSGSNAAGAVVAATGTVTRLYPVGLSPVVINEFRNTGTTTGDMIELLVVSNNLDMRGMIVKDYSGTGANDTGGGSAFSTNDLWASVRAGTIIVLRGNTNSADDVTVGGTDFNLDVGMANTTYFTPLGGSFDISSDDIVQIKYAGSGRTNVSGAIHTMATASTTSAVYFTTSPSPKLRASVGTSPGGSSVIALTPNALVSDYDGAAATGTVTVSSIGTWNTPENQILIQNLRGVVIPDNPASFTATIDSATQITMSWVPNESTEPVLVAWNTNAVFGSPSGAYSSGDAIAGGGTVLYFGSDTSAVHSALAQNATYYYRAWSMSVDTNYSAGVSASATTPIADPPSIAITNPVTSPSAVAYAVTSVPVEGTGVNLEGYVQWTNKLTAGAGAAAASDIWSVPSVALNVGSNQIVVVGTNANGFAATASCVVVRSMPSIAGYGTNVILHQGAEAGDTWALNDGSNAISSATGAGDYPPSQRVRAGSNSFQANNASVTVETVAGSLVGSSNRIANVFVSSTSITSGNGADTGDTVRVYVALDGAAFGGAADITLNGNGNAQWGYDAALAAATVPGMPITVVSPQSGGPNTNNYAQLAVILPDAATSIAIRVVAQNNSTSEVWNVDDIQVMGDLATNGSPSLPTVTIAATDATAAEMAEAADTGALQIARTGDTAAALTVLLGYSGTASNGADVTALPASVVLSAGQSSTTLTVAAIADLLSEGPETLTATVLPDAAYTVGSPSDATVTVADLPADDWRFANFGTNANSATASDTGDANGDGWQNLAAYALGFDPAGAAQGGLSGGVVSGQLSLTFSVLNSRSDITYRAETADALANDAQWTAIWTNKPAQAITGPNATVLGTSGETNTVRISDLNAGTNRFLRLRVTRP